MQSVTLFYSPTCPFSAAAIAFLVAKGADLRLVNLDEHEEERARIEKNLHSVPLETPILETAITLHVAPSPSELHQLLESWGLPASASPHEKLHHGATTQ